MIQKIEWNGLAALKMETAVYEALLIPEVGANLVRLYNKTKGVNFVRTPNPDEIEHFKTNPQVYGLPLLLPPNRIEDGTYTYNGRTYHYPITIPAQNNHHHGCIKSQPFTVTRCEESEGEIVVETAFFSNAFNDVIYSYFPHAFECRMQFRLSDNGLEHTVTFVNLSKEEMPLGVGYHTPINVPFLTGGNKDDYRLRMSVGKKWILTDRLLPTGELVPLEEDEDVWRLRTEEGMKPTGKAIEVLMTAEPIDVDGKPYHGAVMTDTKSGLRLFYEVDDKIKHWTFWNNRGGVDWACPEPMSWAINAPNLKLPKEVTGFTALSPQGTWSTTCKMYVK